MLVTHKIRIDYDLWRAQNINAEKVESSLNHARGGQAALGDGREPRGQGRTQRLPHAVLRFLCPRHPLFPAAARARPAPRPYFSLGEPLARGSDKVTDVAGPDSAMSKRKRP